MVFLDVSLKVLEMCEVVFLKKFGSSYSGVDFLERFAALYP